MSDKPSKFTLHYGDQGTLAEGLFDDIEKAIEKYADVMTLAGIIGVLESIKFAMFMDSFVTYDDDEEGDEDGTETED